MNRAHNFFAGPAVLPYEVLEATRDAVVDFAGLGVSIMEVSHRDKAFDAVIKEAESDLLSLMNLSKDEYSVLFLGGGASLQFAMVPYNFLQNEADYISTGYWSDKAIKEAQMTGKTNIIATSKDDNYSYIPKNFTISPNADYVHITSNNTIYGSEWKKWPDTGNTPLVIDNSSDFLAMERDYNKASLIYAGAQKNVGPAGVTVIVIKKSFVEQKARKDGYTMMKYSTHIEKESLYNTPPVLPIYAVGQTLKWLKKNGGLKAMQEKNEKKAKMIYDVIDAHPDFFIGRIKNKEDRSLMNITWNLPTPELEAKFLEEAKAQKMLGLKGHRSVGGLRASVYNACPISSVEALVNLMEDFYKRNK
ncbi:MAG TPA: 3-phosphoserine/phosphohydroxythreonine transaminase [Bacteroidota bacterium]|nr:3-phosphoserine/phosphohydroxythreonine transaminase [Bacteroidota bacterium]